MTHVLRDMTHVLKDMTHVLRDLTHVLRDLTHVLRDMTHIAWIYLDVRQKFKGENSLDRQHFTKKNIKPCDTLTNVYTRAHTRTHARTSRTRRKP